jgi:2-succinyl-6-hydroxy-2,4-cyclohexadiene-1-carboxylate synthase
VISLHGFLGWPELWQPIKERLAFLEQAARPWLCLDLWQDVATLRRRESESSDAFADWAQLFFARIEKTPLDLNRGNEAKANSVKPLLLGYSLGGRLALDALSRRPDLFSGAVIVSAHPGLGEANSDERRKRLLQDQIWAGRFLTEPWSQLIASWDAQAVLATSAPFAPLASHGGDKQDNENSLRARRPELAWALDHWSVARQGDLRSALIATKSSVLFVAGKRDLKFCELLAPLPQLSSTFQLQILENAGHRAPWDAPAEFAKLLRSWKPG